MVLQLFGVQYIYNFMDQINSLWKILKGEFKPFPTFSPLAGAVLVSLKVNKLLQ
jgi:hypothetical protein